MLLEEEVCDIEVLELFDAFLLCVVFRPQGINAFISAEVEYILLGDFCEKYHYDRLELARILKSGALMMSSLLNQKEN